MEIQNNIAITKNEVISLTKFKNLSINEKPMPQGEGFIKISPFDDYFLFTLYDEIDGEDTPIDLSNVGDIFMTFIGSSDEIRIKNYKQITDINISQGEVLFRISTEESRKILALDSRDFYISSVMVDVSGKSDESVLYTGKFISFQEEPPVSLSKQIEEDRLVFSRELAKLQEEIDRLNDELNKRDELISEQEVIINALKESNINLSNEIELLVDSLPNAKIEKVLKEAQEIQKTEELLSINTQQIQANQSGNNNQNQRSFYLEAARRLRSNSTRVNVVTSGGRADETTASSTGTGNEAPPPGPLIEQFQP